MLDGFKIVNLATGFPTISITKNGVALNKASIIKLDYAERVYLMIDETGKRIAVQRCEADDESSVPFYRKQKSMMVRWNNADLESHIEKMMNWDLKTQGYKAAGEFLDEDKALIFDLNKATDING